jgi:transcriptional regulator with XRE-family HTH domain
MTASQKHNNELGELYMMVRDHTQFASVVICQRISQRELARAAGWSSHSYLGRLLRGEEDTLSDEAALRIAHRLGLPVNMLFDTVVSEKTGHSVRANGKSRKKSGKAA